MPLDTDPGCARRPTAPSPCCAAPPKRLCARAAGRRPPARADDGLHVWAMSHGIASLFGRGDPGRRTLPMTPEELLEAAVLIYLRGLGLIGALTAS